MSTHRFPSSHSLGSKLREARLNKELTLRASEKATGIDKATISKLERGERSYNEHYLHAFAKLYDISYRELSAILINEKLRIEISKQSKYDQTLIASDKGQAYKLPESPAELIKALAREIKRDGRIAAAWIFGSFVSRKATAHSDVDIIIEFNKKRKYSLFDLIDLAHLLEQKTNCKIDLVEKGQLKEFAQASAKKSLIQVYG